MNILENSIVSLFISSFLHLNWFILIEYLILIFDIPLGLKASVNIAPIQYSLLINPTRIWNAFSQLQIFIYISKEEMHLSIFYLLNSGRLFRRKISSFQWTNCLLYFLNICLSYSNHIVYSIKRFQPSKRPRVSYPMFESNQVHVLKIGIFIFTV